MRISNDQYQMKILHDQSSIGTRLKAHRMGAVIRALRAVTTIDSIVCVSGKNPKLLVQLNRHGDETVRIDSYAAEKNSLHRS